MLVRVVEFEFETQDVFDLTHSDPSGIGHEAFQQKAGKTSPFGLGKICAAPARRLIDSVRLS